MNKFIKFIKKFFGIQHYRLFIACIDTDTRIDLVLACCEAEINDITEESIARSCECSIENVKIIKECIISHRCAMEFINSSGIENCYKTEVIL